VAESSKRFRDLVQSSRDERTRVRALVAANRWKDAEPNRDRFSRFFARAASKVAPRGRESLQGDTIDFQPAWFLGEGAIRRRAVAYVEVNSAGKSSVGTGFMISPQLFLTNQHVVESEVSARGAQISFNRETGEDGRLEPITTFLLDPDRFALFSQEEELDYAIVAVGSRIAGTGAVADFGYCPLLDRANKHVIGMTVNIVQHPNGMPKVITVRNNILQFRTERTLLYQTDTDHGSSGAPVFNDDWDIVALHHYGEPFLESKDEGGQPIPTNINEGVRISAIYKDLDRTLETLPAATQPLLREALAYDKLADANAAGRHLSPPHAGIVSSAESAPRSMEEPSMSQSSDDQQFRVMIPLEITIRVGSAAAPEAQVAAPQLLKTLKRSAEKLQVDTDYTNRSGYDPDFIPGVHIPLPEPNPKLAKQVASLRAGEANAAGGELEYEHFSIKMNKSKRIALFTATNIDGETYLVVDRKTGEVTGGAEGETWFSDPRVSSSFFLDQSFYSAWSHLFDRGHLTRRTDPTWGDDDTAKRANADTFHFTNCSPQHFRFNQTAKFWQGVERYVLENGVLAAGTGKHLSVFQGPIFNDAVDRWADDVQIPSSFFKVIVWKGEAGLRSVGLVVDQLPLLDEERKNLGAPQDLPSIDVRHWRVAIETIEKRTGLSFGPDVLGADTISKGTQPRVGEAQVEVRSLADIPLI
jgi:endonuclease G, mitochondrial